MRTSINSREGWDRLRSRSDFLAVRAARKRWTAPGFTLEVQPRPAQETVSRYGLTVSKKVSAKAVIRNRIRRRLRALVNDALMPQGRKGVDYVLIARPDALTRSYDEMLRDLRWCLKRLDLLAEGGA